LILGRLLPSKYRFSAFGLSGVLTLHARLLSHHHFGIKLKHNVHIEHNSKKFQLNEYKPTGYHVFKLNQFTTQHKQIGNCLKMCNPIKMGAGWKIL
jgi:hypothetical protein